MARGRPARHLVPAVRGIGQRFASAAVVAATPEMQPPPVDLSLWRLQAPEKRRLGYIKAGRVNTYKEIVRIDAEGIATGRTPTAKRFCELLGFTPAP